MFCDLSGESCQIFHFTIITSQLHYVAREKVKVTDSEHFINVGNLQMAMKHKKYFRVNVDRHLSLIRNILFGRRKKYQLLKL